MKLIKFGELKSRATSSLALHYNQEMTNSSFLPLGKLPPALLAQVLSGAPVSDERVILGPGVGLDCAVIDLGERLLVLKSEPITFVTSSLGWYALQVSVNDIATSGASPRWYLASLLLPEGQTTPELVLKIGAELFAACRELGISVVGGHTEVTHGIDHPILAGALIGEVAPDALVTPRGARSGDRVLLTKSVPIEGTAILAQEFPERLAETLSAAEIARAAGYLHDPGISVLKDAQTVVGAGKVTAMHDPTEGGLAAALWELAEASGKRLVVDVERVPVSELSARVCMAFGLDPLATIASGALLLTAAEESAASIQAALEEAGIPCAQIGRVEEGEWGVWTVDGEQMLRPERDEITKVFE